MVGITITGDEELHAANDAFLELIGRSREELAAGLSWIDITAPESAEADERAMRDLRTLGRAAPYEKVYARPDGTRVPVILSGMRLQEDPLLVIASIYDMSARRAAEAEVARSYERERAAREAAELAGARIARLQEITAGLSAARSPAEIAKLVVAHAVEDVTASAGLLARVDRGDLAVSHAIGYRSSALDDWRRFPLGRSSPLSDAVRSGLPVVVNGAEDWEARYPEVGGGVEFAALVALPLTTDRAIGVLGLSFRAPRDFSAEDLEFLEAIGRQAAAALERAQLFENRAYVANRLQDGLLPDRLAEVPGLETAVRYRSISGGGEVGGDFYDLFEAGPERWALAVGDVCGKGTEAAVVTGLARHTVRAAARMGRGPGPVLEFLNEALRDDADLPSFCTVACGVLTRDGDGFAICLASGGHPFPILLREDGTIERVEVGGPMLGAVEAPRLGQVQFSLARGDTLVLYTDGIIDARRPGGEHYGEHRLLGILSEVAGASADAVAGAIDDDVSRHAPDVPADDRAVLVIRAA